MKAVVFDAAAQDALDITSSNMLKSLVKRLHNQSIITYFAEVQDPVLDFSAKSGLLDLISEDHLFSTLDKAVHHIESEQSQPTTPVETAEPDTGSNPAGTEDKA